LDCVAKPYLIYSSRAWKKINKSKEEKLKKNIKIHLFVKELLIIKQTLTGVCVTAWTETPLGAISALISFIVPFNIINNYCIL